ncbi:hypothetical protein ACBJ59_61285 [Nonomuraea sp. MTCD27]|uniref:hypothetical protein n=1 Tax=Nonomuraea sp. MTCD27 TaxID=1676747 RepID=UPI0035BF4AF3
MADITMPGAIIGYRRNGRPIRLQAGGSEGAPEPQPAGDGGSDAGQGQGDGDGKPAKTEPAKGDDGGDDKPLGTGGQKALEAERAKAREAEKRAREAERKVKQFEDANKSDLEKAASRADQAEQRAQALVDRTVKAEIRAAAADSFADPSDAAAFLDLAAYAGEDDEVDTDKIKADLADLLKRKPHLGKAGRKGPKPDPSQGARPGGTPDLAVQIAEAEKAGNHREAIRLKRQQAALTTTT